MRRPYLTPWSIRLHLKSIQWDRPNHVQVLFSFHATSIDSHIKPELDQRLHLLYCPCKAMNESPFGQFVQPSRDDSLKVLAAGSGMEEEGQLYVLGQIQLKLKVFELNLLGRKKQPIVVQTDFPKGHCMTTFLGFKGESAKILDQDFWPTFVMVKILGRARVNSNSRITNTGYKCVSKDGQYLQRPHPTYGIVLQSRPHDGTLADWSP